MSVSDRNRKKLSPPMHQVYRSLTPDFRRRTGCRCRNTFDNITSTRLRSLFGRPCRKIDVQTCVSVSQFQNLTGALAFGSTVFVSAILDR